MSSNYVITVNDNNKIMINNTETTDITSNGIYVLNNNIQITDITQFLNIINNDDKDEIVIDGQFNTIILLIKGTDYDYKGFIRNGKGNPDEPTVLISKGRDNVTIKNINIVWAHTSSTAGILCGPHFGSGALNNTIINCSFNGSTIYYGSGLCGPYCASHDGSVTIKNCYVINNTLAYSSGGICGWYGAYKNGNILIENCYSYNKSYIDLYAGSIYGQYCGLENGKLTINSCYSFSDTLKNTNIGGPNCININITNCLFKYSEFENTIKNILFPNIDNDTRTQNTQFIDSWDDNDTIIIQNTQFIDSWDDNIAKLTLGNYKENVWINFNINQRWEIDNNRESDTEKPDQITSNKKTSTEKPDQITSNKKTSTKKSTQIINKTYIIILLIILLILLALFI